MKKLILIYILVLGFMHIGYASETTGTIETGVSTSGLEFSLPCNPASVTYGSVNSKTCAITCNSGYGLSGTSCVLQSSGGGGGGGGSTVTTCLDSQLECRGVSGVFKLYRKSGVSCDGGNLGKTCVISSSGSTSSGSTSSGSSVTTSSGSNSSNLDNSLLDDALTNFDNLGDNSGGNDGTDTTGGNDGTENGDNGQQNNDLIGGFLDIGNSFAKSYINRLVLNGIVNGYIDNTFRPELPASRIEYLKMVLRTIKIDYSAADVSNIPFSDVDKTTWQAKVVAKALELGIITSKNLEFRPDSTISRAESMKILMLAGSFTLDDKAISSFSDVNGWAVKYVEKAKQLGIVNGQLVEGKLLFRPIDDISRGEVAKILVKTMDLLNK